MNNKHGYDQKLDEYEKDILDEIHSGKSKTIPNVKEFMDQAKRSAQEFTKMKRKSIHIRVPERNLDFIRKQANLQGLPYQTLINSIIQQYVEGKRKA